LEKGKEKKGKTKPKLAGLSGLSPVDSSVWLRVGKGQESLPFSL